MLISEEERGVCEESKVSIHKLKIASRRRLQEHLLKNLWTFNNLSLIHEIRKSGGSLKIEQLLLGLEEL